MAEQPAQPDQRWAARLVDDLVRSDAEDATRLVERLLLIWPQLHPTDRSEVKQLERDAVVEIPNADARLEPISKLPD